MKWSGDRAVLIVENATEVSLSKAATLIASSAKERVPVDTGELKESIEIQLSENEISVGTDKPYAMKIEYGGSSQAPNGFLRAALDENKQEILNIFKNEIGTDLKKE